MICIRITKGEEGLELLAEGHADYAPRGQDIVCAGVSALLYGYLTYLRELPPIATAEVSPPEERLWEIKEEDGRLWVRTRGLRGRDVEGFSSIEAGLRLLAGHYPHHVRLDIYRKGEEHEPG